ncbi:MAG: helix-turn-helix domain-containing protein, partial [Planctomycetota bacterium]|nr:helix-turn-helix domain-containing protein [Planctomycetota bacterium]
EKSCAEAKRNVKGFTNEALEALRQYSWPGNVRELANVVERAVVLCAGENIGPADLPAEIGGAGGKGATVEPRFGEDAIARLMTFEEAEKALVIKALKHTGGKKGEAAKLLGISWPTLNKKIADYGIEV